MFIGLEYATSDSVNEKCWREMLQFFSHKSPRIVLIDLLIGPI